MPIPFNSAVLATTRLEPITPVAFAADRNKRSRRRRDGLALGMGGIIAFTIQAILRFMRFRNRFLPDGTDQTMVK